MKKRDNGNNGNIGFILLIILIICVVTLFIGALIVQYGVYGGKFPTVASAELQYALIACLVALPVLLVLLLLVSKNNSRDTSSLSADYFGVDSEKSHKERQKLRNYDGIPSEPVDGDTFPLPSIPTKTEDEKEEEVNEGGSRFYMLT
ncbi:MAG: hypothetical protein J1G05_06705, partial [Clostridiales bacterium]|nr:hypothetical protein [Clostridiales bacterium]